MDTYGPMYEKMFQGGCGSLVTGKIDYLVYVQAEQAAFPVCANASDPLGYSTCVSGGATRVINLFECTCKANSLMDPLDCPMDCPDYHRYRTFAPTQQNNFDQWFHWALPVRDDLVEVVSLAMLLSRLNADLQTAMDAQLSKLSPKYNLPGDVSGQNDPVNVKSLAGLYIYATSFIALALMTHAIMRVVKCARARFFPPHDAKDVEVEKVTARWELAPNGPEGEDTVYVGDDELSLLRERLAELASLIDARPHPADRQITVTTPSAAGPADHPAASAALAQTVKRNQSPHEDTTVPVSVTDKFLANSPTPPPPAVLAPALAPAPVIDSVHIVGVC